MSIRIINLVLRCRIWLGCSVFLMLMQACLPRDEHKLAASPSSLEVVLSMPHEQLAQVDIAQLNVLCAEGLPGCEQVCISNTLSLLDNWAARVKSETTRHAYRFERSSAEFENSRGFYKLLMLGVVLAEDYRVHYRTDRQVSPNLAGMNDGFFADARDVFLPGLLGESRSGTCSSMPVLYVAIGRRLGYPLKLVTTS